MEDEGKVKARRMGDNKEMEVARSVDENAGNGIGDYGEGRREREGGRSEREGGRKERDGGRRERERKIKNG